MRLGWLLTLASFAGLGACFQIAGIGDFRDGESQAASPGGSSTTAMGGTSAGGTGGAGGTSTGGVGGTGGVADVEAPNWTVALDAVYNFEGVPLGADSSLSGFNLTVAGSPSPTANLLRKQGSQSAGFAFGGGFSVSNSAFSLMSNDSFTLGGWFRPADTVSHQLVGTPGDIGKRYQLRQVGDQALCINGNGTSTVTATSPPGAIAVDQWVHISCTYSGSFDEMLRLYVDGVEVDAKMNPSSFVDVPDFYVTQQTYNGLMDELFFARQALSEQKVRRVYSCGVDGAKCMCDGADTAAFANCGELEATNDCALLTLPCHLVSP